MGTIRSPTSHPLRSLRVHFYNITFKTNSELSKGLFTRKEGYPFSRVTLTSGLKLALVYKQISHEGLPYHLSQLYKLC